MNYHSYLEDAFKSGMMVNTELSLDQLFQHYYVYPDAGKISDHSDQIPGPFLHLLAGGDISVEMPFAFRLHLKSEIMVLKCQKGGIRVQGSRKSWQVTAGSYLVCPCDSFSIRSMLLPCAYQMLVVGGAEHTLFLKTLGEGILSDSTKIPALDVYFMRLKKIPERIDTRSFLLMHQAICDLITSICTWLPDGDTAVSDHTPPYPYLQSIHDQIRNHPEHSFSLLYFEQEYHISRYRICREYAEFYGVPPLRDCNTYRIRHAEKLLLTTDFQVQEISHRCGFENVNHFIHLFRKHSGMTPGQFRKKAQAYLLFSACAFFKERLNVHVSNRFGLQIYELISLLRQTQMELAARFFSRCHAE